MKQLRCEICDGDAILKEGEHFRCTQCGACYTAEQLKNMLALSAPEHKEKTVAPQAVSKKESPSLLQQIRGKIRLFRIKLLKREKGKSAILSAIPFVVLVLFLIVVFATSVDGSDKATAKSCVERDIRARYEDDEITISKFDFETVKVDKFRTREEDPVGYFDYMDKPISVRQKDGSLKQYDSQFASMAEGYIGEYDPEVSVKYAYTVEGTFEGAHVEDGDFTAEFEYIYVEEQNVWRPIKSECKPTYDALREDLRNYLTAYVITAYEISGSPKINISYIDAKANGDYLVYGTIDFRGKYGEEYTVRFDAEYERWDYELTFERKEVNVEYPG